MSFRVNFVLASNTASSITRVVVEYANALVTQGVEVHICYPVFSFWDHCLWVREQEGAFGGGRFLLSLARSARLSWQGSVVHALHPGVRLHRFWALPSARRMPDADAIVVMQSYLVPRLLFLPESKGVLVSSVHMDYRQGIQDADLAARRWWVTMLRIEQRIAVARFAVSTVAKDSAEGFGIFINRVIRNGLNLREFSARNGTNNPGGPLRVMLFCAALAAKGQEFGCEVVRRLKEEYSKPHVSFVSIGNVSQKNKPLFDENLGYLHGREYVSAYQQADVFIYPSLRDGFPAPPLEALGCGAALAATRVSGVIEYGASGTNCLLAEPNNVEAMVNNVRRLIDDPQLRASLRQEGYKTVRAYSWQQSASELLDFIHEVKTSA